MGSDMNYRLGECVKLSDQEVSTGECNLHIASRYVADRIGHWSLISCFDCISRSHFFVLNAVLKFSSLTYLLYLFTYLYDGYTWIDLSLLQAASALCAISDASLHNTTPVSSTSTKLSASIPIGPVNKCISFHLDFRHMFTNINWQTFFFFLYEVESHHIFSRKNKYISISTM